jgi:hypothetical protein
MIRAPISDIFSVSRAIRNWCFSGTDRFFVIIVPLDTMRPAGTPRRHNQHDQVS